MAYILRFENDSVLSLDRVKDLFKRAFPEGSLVCNPGFEASIERFADMMYDPLYGIFAVCDGESLVGLSLVLLPTDENDPYPQVLHLYHQGDAQSRRQLIDATVDFIRESGYISFRAINATSKADSVWARLFSRAGAARRIGSIMEFKVDERGSKNDIRGRHSTDK
jgi:hypothetical protein